MLSFLFYLSLYQPQHLYTQKIFSRQYFNNIKILPNYKSKDQFFPELYCQKCLSNTTTKWLVQSSTERALLIEKQCQIFAVRIIHRGHILPSHNVSKPFESHKDFPWYPVNKRSDLHLPRFHSYGRFITALCEDMARASKLEHCISSQADKASSSYFAFFWCSFFPS